MGRYDDLHDRVAIITGATGGLGSALVPAFLEQGALVVAVGRHADSVHALAAGMSSYGERLATEVCELDDADQVAALARRALDRWGRIDALVNSAGGFAGGQGVGELPEEQWHAQLDTNLTSAFHCCRAVLPVMERQDYGRIVNVASRAAVRAGKNMAAYAVAKSGVVALTQAIAEEQRDRNVTANAVLPGTIDTPSNRRAMPNAGHDRWVSPGAIASVILFLCSADAGIVSGALVPVYGRS